MKKSQPRTAPAANASGFTILELMITVSVLAILLGVAVPSFTQMIRQNRLATQTNDLLTATALARSEAVKRGVRVTLCPANAFGNNCSGNAQWGTGWLVITDAGPNIGTLDPGEMILQSVPAPEGLIVANVENVTSISYRASGATELAAVTTFTITNDPCNDPQGRRAVEVLRSGRTSVTRQNCG